MGPILILATLITLPVGGEFAALFGTVRVTAGAFAAGAAVGYGKSALDTHTLTSVADLKGGVDGGAFAACIVATAARCAFIAGVATGIDYGYEVGTTGEWGGQNLHDLINSAVFDIAGYGLGRMIEIRLEQVTETGTHAGASPSR